MFAATKKKKKNKKKEIQQINSNLGTNITHVSHVGKDLKIML